MMAPEELAKEYGRKEWKYFMSDTGMACRSGMTHTAAPLFSVCWTRDLLGEDVKKASLGVLLGFIGIGCIFLPRVSDFFLAFGSVLIKIFLIWREKTGI